jgi:lipoprotein-releasing system permease protein
MLIGVLGSLTGLVAGYGFSFAAGRYRLLRLQSDIYSISYVPFDLRWRDGLLITVAALAISYLATLYPARSAARVLPAEALRYE